MSDSPDRPTVSDPDCAGCALAGRRDFLADVGRFAVAALVAGGLAPSRAGAMPLRLATALASHGSTKSYAVPAADGVQIDKDAEVILARAGKSVWAFALSCPHQNTALRWEAGDKRFQCPKHKSRYGVDGTYIEGRATRSMDRYAVKQAGNTIVVDLDELYREDADAPKWKAAVVSLADPC